MERAECLKPVAAEMSAREPPNTTIRGTGTAPDGLTTRSTAVEVTVPALFVTTTE